VDLSTAVKPSREGCFLSIKAQPRSYKETLVGVENGELKLRVKAPPVDGAANEAVLRFLANALGVAITNLSVERGHASRHKVVYIRGMDVQKVLGALSKESKRD
jgi:uncharacterized protein (TIGR00251 family)